MTWFGIWWVFPLVCLGLMVAISLGAARRGWRGCRLPSTLWGGEQGRIHKLEAEVDRLKHELARLGGRSVYR